MNIRSPVGPVLALLFAGALGALKCNEVALPAPSPERRIYQRIDTHVHLSTSELGRLNSLMKEHDFWHIVNLSGGHPTAELELQLDIAKRHGNITVFAGLAYEQITHLNYGERMARMVRLAHHMGARGIKIPKHLGLGLNGRDGKLIAVDDVGLDPVFRMAGKLGMPVAIHTGDPKTFWDPIDATNERYAELSAHPRWSQFGRNSPSFDELLGQLERRIQRHPNTTFISVHFGNCAEEPKRVAGMLRSYPNLYIDTAARIPEFGRHPPAEMLAFFTEFQDRILYGSDLGVGPGDTPLFLGSSGAEPSTDAERERFFRSSYRYFETADKAFEHPTPIQGDWAISGIDLPPEILEKLYFGNAAKLLKLSK
ncbi:MAG: amidohydrolase family protein [Polyangiaceae bacterium]|nr:amidohydrolase family protein [Polyangiaceae bacterium]